MIIVRLKSTETTRALARLVAGFKLAVSGICQAGANMQLAQVRLGRAWARRHGVLERYAAHFDEQEAAARACLAWAQKEQVVIKSYLARLA